jgi:hypothetical protein
MYWMAMDAGIHIVLAPASAPAQASQAVAHWDLEPQVRSFLLDLGVPTMGDNRLPYRRFHI